MKREIAMEWVEALRSGKYEQTTGQLREGNKFCVLGVLCDIAPKSVGQWGGISGELFSGHDMVPPGALLEWADITYSETDRFAQDNDDGRTFAQIADDLQKRLDNDGE